MEAAPEAAQTIAYTRFVLDRGVAGDRLDLEVALAPCIVGYALIAAERIADPATRHDGNPYREWLDMYAGAEYQELAHEAEAALDELFARRGGEGALSLSGRRFRHGYPARSRFLADGARRRPLTAPGPATLGLRHWRRGTLRNCWGTMLLSPGGAPMPRDGGRGVGVSGVRRGGQRPRRR